MAQVPFQALYNGPFAVYTSPTGMASPITGTPYLGGALHEGDYVDLTRSEAAIWNVQYGNKLYPGRYRLVRVSVNATNTNFGFGYPVGYGLGTYIDNAIVAAAGSGYTITAGGASSGTVVNQFLGGRRHCGGCEPDAFRRRIERGSGNLCGREHDLRADFHSVERSDRWLSGFACRAAVRESDLHQFVRLVLVAAFRRARHRLDYAHGGADCSRCLDRDSGAWRRASLCDHGDGNDHRLGGERGDSGSGHDHDFGHGSDARIHRLHH